MMQSADGKAEMSLEAELESFMLRIMESVQTRANEEGLEILLWVDEEDDDDHYIGWIDMDYDWIHDL